MPNANDPTDAHSERYGGHHNTNRAGEKSLLNLGSLLSLHASMIRSRFMTASAKVIGDCIALEFLVNVYDDSTSIQRA